MRTQAFLLISSIALAVPAFAVEEAEKRPDNAATPAMAGGPDRSATAAVPGNTTAKELTLQNRPGTKKGRIRYTIPPAGAKRM